MNMSISIDWDCVSMTRSTAANNIYSVGDLKTFCSLFGLSRNGNKQELVTRLLSKKKAYLAAVRKRAQGRYDFIDSSDEDADDDY